METPKSWDGNGVEGFLSSSLWTLKFYGFNNLTDINYLLNMEHLLGALGNMEIIFDL